MIRHNIAGIADVVDALEEEIRALSIMDPYDPQISRLHERLRAAVTQMYATAPRGV